jgi:hypothetical protein
LEIAVLVDGTLIPDGWCGVFTFPSIEKVWIEFVAVVESLRIRERRQGGTCCHFLEFAVADPSKLLLRSHFCVLEKNVRDEWSRLYEVDKLKLCASVAAACIHSLK